MLQTGVWEEVEEDEMPRRAYFGKRKEMKRMDIDALFGSPVAKNAEPCMPTCEAAPSSAPDCIEEEEGERSAGRKKKKLFRFNKERYDRMKENDNFRLEF